MKKVQKIAGKTAFNQLDKKHKEAVIMLFEATMTDEEIAKKLQIGNRTLYNWKNKQIFQDALMEYSVRQINKALPGAVKELIHLIKESKSDMVKLQAIQTVFKHAGLLSDNSTPELDKARLRKAIAEAELTEIKAEQLKHIDENAEDKLSRIADVLWGDSSDKGK